MKRKLLVIFSIFFALNASAYGEQSAEDILKAIVKIKSVIPANAFTARTLGTEREGNGVVIDSKGHILTIGYLIMEAETLEVTTGEGKAISASFVGYDHNSGFGLLKADQPLKITPMKLGKSSEVKQGDPILMAGYGGTESVQAGRVIARKEFAGYWEYLLEDAIYTAPAHTGFGGAALIDRDGKLLELDLFSPRSSFRALVLLHATFPSPSTSSIRSFQTSSPKAERVQLRAPGWA